MVILSQNKEMFINFNNVQAINVHKQNKKQVCAWFNVDADPKRGVILGEYRTEERAKEVLVELINTISQNMVIDLCTQLGDMSKANELEYEYYPKYVMPEN